MIAAMTLAMMLAGDGPGMTLPEDLLNVGVVTCVMVDDDGAVSQAYVVASTTAPEKDAEIVATIKQLHWGKALPGDRSRNIWFPIGLAFGDAKAPPSPQGCVPPPNGQGRAQPTDRAPGAGNGIT
jgi:hypothetical protein